MQTRKAPDLWGLHENKTCMFPIKVVSFFFPTYCLLRKMCSIKYIMELLA